MSGATLQQRTQRKQPQAQAQPQTQQDKHKQANATSATHGTTPTSHAFHVFRHLRDAFVRPEGGRMNALDGYRVCLCLWMFMYHGTWYMSPFCDSFEYAQLIRHHVGSVINTGIVAVDGFFVLTGFLLAYPLFCAEQKKPDTMWSFSVSDFWYRRMTRMLPIYYFFLIMVACVIFPNDVLFPRSLMHSSAFGDLIDKLSGATGQDAQGLSLLMPANMLAINQLLPLGGFAAWTWSLAVQLQFYLWFPVLYARCRSAHRTVSVLWYVLFASISLRVYGFFHMRAYHQQERHALFVVFWFYANTLTRINAIILGVFLAYYSLFTCFLSHLRSSRLLRAGLWISAIAIIGANHIIIECFQRGDVLLLPIRGSVAASQTMAPLAITWANLSRHMSYVHRVLYHALVDIGSPLSGMFFGVVLIMSLHGIGTVGRVLNRIMSWAVWYPISVLSYWIYLFHPAIMIKYYTHLALASGAPLPSVVPTVMSTIALVFVMVFVLSLFCHLLIERPLDLLLRSSSHRWLTRAVVWYCKLLCGVSVLAHVITTVIFAWWLPVDTSPAQVINAAD